MKNSDLEERKPLMEGHRDFPGDSSYTENEKTPLQRRGVDENEKRLDIEEVLYSIHSFMAVLKPVSLTMFLASFATIYVQSDLIQQDGGLSAYEVFDTSANTGASNSVRLGESVVNALIIVGVLAVATFGIVLLYKFRCMKCLVGYMMLSSVMLLGAMGGMLFFTLLEKWQVPIDIYTFFFVCYNFAVVGVTAIFYQKGIPTIVTQGYLVATSIIMAWQLSRFEEWTGWSLLVVLAFYDLCAVLSPCGPLKALVNLMQEYKEPMPGLLYEAELRPSTSSSQHMRGASSTPAREAKEQQLLIETPEQPEASPSRHSAIAYEEDEDDDRTIKLGLGDFVFYSVLVSKAAMFGFVTCVSCFVVIISGLGGTLILLSIYRTALPALPISIFLGVLFYLLIRVTAVPYLDALSQMPIYI